MAEYNDPPPPYSPSPDLPPPSSPLPYSPPTAPTVDYNLPLFEGTAPPAAATADTTQHTRHAEDVDGHRIYPDIRFENDARSGHRRHGDTHRRDVDGQGRHGDRHRRDADGQGRYGDRHRRDADGQGRHGDRHRRDVNGHRRDADGNRRDADGQGRYDDRHRRDADGHRRDADGNRRDADGQGRYDDRHRRDADGHRRDADGNRRDADGQGRYDDRHRRDADGHRRDADGNRRDADGQGRYDDRHRRDADGNRRDADGQGRYDDRHRRDADGHGRDADGDRRDADGQGRRDADGQGRRNADGQGRRDADGQGRDGNGYRQDIDERRIDLDVPHESDNENFTEWFQNATNTFSGFINIMHDKKKPPLRFAQNTIYKLGLCVYFFINVIYSIVATSVQRGQLPYHLMYVFISFIGFVIELGVIIIVTTRKCFPDRRDDRETRSKEISVLVDYVLSSIGEFLIYPTLICVMYGFINERSWQFDNGISRCNLILLVYSVIMDALYMKFYVIWLVIRIVQASYDKHDELVGPTKVDWKRYFTPVYLSIPLAFTTALTHWLMTGIIGVRIYVDNFTLDKDNTNSSIPDTGDYRVAPLTGYMIVCTIYLPIVSWITYIILNKLWFYEVYSAINQLKPVVNHMQPQDRWAQNTYEWNEKLADFIKDPLAYISIVFLIVSFIAFTVGTYLPDYDSPEYEVASSARGFIQALGAFFILSFLLSNLQATIIVAITVLVIVTFILIVLGVIVYGEILILCGLPVLCVVLCYKKFCTLEQ